MNNISQNFPFLNIMKIHPEVLELFHANRLTGQFYYALQRDVNMPKMSHMMTHIQQNLKLQFEETLRIHSVPKRLE